MVRGPEAVDAGAMTSAIVLVVTLLAAGAVLLAASTRTIPMHSAGVVTRSGRVVRVVGPGTSLLLPGVDEVHLVSSRPTRTEPVAVEAVTRDGAALRLLLAMVWDVRDPMATVRVEHFPGSATEQAVAAAVRHSVAAVDTEEFLAGREAMMRQVPAMADEVTGAWGVTVLDVELLDVELRAGPELLRRLLH